MITLVDAAGTTSAVQLNPAPAFTRPAAPLASRTVYAAAHVVPRTTSDNVPGAPADLDWDATLAFRHHLWSWGLGVADAMDTAQRNMGLDPAATRELISRSAAEARSVGGALVVGVNTDHVDDAVITLDAVIDAYKEQLHLTEDAGASVVLMASRHLARAARTAEDYERVYSEVLAAAGAPVILHWLGSAFDPELGTYFGSTDTEAASSTLLKINANSPDKVAGVKMSLLDAGSERAVRSQLNAPVRMFTGDDFNYVSLIGGDS
ncbi:MAG: dihydrodipicolinate synthase family protein, partial [Micrococcaceae bacterium]|nr:dihydrodipicolinate synthase family protein [Micrococcaceae bacterium]